MKDKESSKTPIGDGAATPPLKVSDTGVVVEVRRSIRILAAIVAVLGLFGLIALVGLALIERNALGWVGAFLLAPFVGLFGKFALRGRFRVPSGSTLTDPSVESLKPGGSSPPLPEPVPWRLGIRITFLFVAMLCGLVLIFAKFPGVLVRSVTGACIGIVLVLAIVWICAFIADRRRRLPRR